MPTRFGRLATVALLVPALFCAVSRAEKKKASAAFGQATYAYVQAMDGDEYSADLAPEDRDAIVDVRDALRKWGRYRLTTRPGEADLVFVVRRGRRAAAKGGVMVERPGQGQRTLGGMLGGEVGPGDDMLEVHMTGSGSSLGTLVWQRSESNGLDRPYLPLLGQLKSVVEHDYPAARRKP